MKSARKNFFGQAEPVPTLGHFYAFRSSLLHASLAQKSRKTDGVKLGHLSLAALHKQG